ncbi:hypothetical protein VPH35_094662 [Triticum aestivum]
MSSLRYKPRRVTDADAAIARDPSLWGTLPGELLDLIAWQVLAVGDLQDYARLRAVCAHWRASTACPRGRGIVDQRFHPRQWMMLPEGHGLYPGSSRLRGFIRFFNLSTGAFAPLDSIDGLLLLQRDHDTVVRLLHPFTGDILDFPPLETLLRHVGATTPDTKWCLVRNISAASMNVGADGVVSVMILMAHPWSKIVFATSQDRQWRVSSWFASRSCRPISFQGKIYAVRFTTSFASPEGVEMEPWLAPPRSIAKCPASTPDTFYTYHLVECGPEILVVILSHNYNNISVYRLADLMLGMFVPMTRIGGNALFIEGRTLCVSSKAFPTIVGDTIVFLNWKQHCLAQYHLGSDTLLSAEYRFADVYAMKIPCSIIQHIYTCCYRKIWNKGQMVFRRKQNKWRVNGKWRIGVSNLAYDGMIFF